MNDSQIAFTEKLIQNSQSELSMAIASNNLERVDCLQARILAYQQTLEEHEND
jgi:hypothetical protein